MEKQQHCFAFLLAWPFDSLGGVNGVLKNLLREFHAHADFAPIAMEISGETEEVVPGTETRAWPLVRTGPISSWDAVRPWRSLAAFCLKLPLLLLKLRRICRENSIAILNPHFIGIEYLALWPFRRLGIFSGRLIFSFHGSDIRAMIQSRGLERRLLRMMVSGADLLVACSEGLREEILLFVPECAARTVTVHNGIDTAAFLSLAGAPFELPPSFSRRKILLNVGAYEYKKGHDTLLRAFAEVRTNHPEAALVIAGQRSSAAVAKLATELGVNNDLLLLESIPYAQVVALLKRADLFVLSSRWEKGVCGEGFAMVLLEAGAALKAVVSTNSCGTSELLQDGLNGRVVPTEDPHALALAISELLANPEAANEMATRLHKRVVQEFTWNKAYNKYLELARPENLLREAR